MYTMKDCIKNYLEYCQHQKRLDKKTLKAYRIDLRQFYEKNPSPGVSEITARMLEHYIASLHAMYKPKTVKRKIASLKALFHYLEYRNIIDHNPFNKTLIYFREPVILPKTIPLHTVETLLQYTNNAKLRKPFVKKKTPSRMRRSWKCSLPLA